MKRLIVFVSLFALGALAACSPIGDGTHESCIGPYTGTFTVESSTDGPLEGRILAYLAEPKTDPEDRQPELELNLTFDTETAMELMDQRVPAALSDTGDVTDSSSIFNFVGTFDFDDCEASGTWTGGTVYSNGTWRLTVGHSAF